MEVSPDQLTVVSALGLVIALCAIRYLTRSRRRFFGARRAEMRVARFEERARMARIGIVMERARERNSYGVARAASPSRGASRRASKPIGRAQSG